MRVARKEFESQGRINARTHGMIDALLLVAIGIQLLRPEDTFLTSPIYSVMSRVMSEEKWGTVLLILGSLRAMVILFGIKQPENPRALKASMGLSLLSVGTFFGLAITFFVVNPLGIQCLANLAFAAHDFSNYWTVSRMAGVTNGRVRLRAPP